MKYVKRLFYMLVVTCMVIGLLIPSMAGTKKPGKPNITGVQSTANNSGTVTFNPVSNAKGYQIQFAQNSKFSKGKKTVNTSSTSATKNGLTGGKKYYVRVRAYTKKGKKNIYGSWSSTKTFNVNTIPTPGKPGISSVVSKNKGTGTVYFNYTRNATRYEVQFAQNSKFTKGKKSTSTTATNATVKGLSVGKKYYVRVRAFNQNKSGSWSGTKTVKITNNHTHDYYLAENTATCTSSGLNIYRCDCGASYSTGAAATGHNWYIQSDNQPVKCIDGTRTYKCRNCGTTKTETIKASQSHSFYVYTEDDNAKHQACRNCGTLGPDIKKEKPTDPATNYSYEIKVLNKLPIYSSVIYDNKKFDRTNVFVYIKTNNPNYNDLFIYGDVIGYSGTPQDYKDLVYEKIVYNTYGDGFFKVKNGYVFVTSGPEHAGKYSIKLKSLSTGTQLASAEFNALDGLALAKQEVQNIVNNSNITSNMSTYDKCLKVANYMSTNYKYKPVRRGSDLNSNDSFIPLISHEGLIFQTKELMCTQSHEIYKYIVEHYFGVKAATDPQYNHTATRVYLDNGKYQDSYGKYFVFESSPTVANYVDSWSMIDPS